eukprot:114877-Pelagomonas_calceolata.AAC.1
MYDCNVRAKLVFGFLQVCPTLIAPTHLYANAQGNAAPLGVLACMLQKRLFCDALHWCLSQCQAPGKYVRAASSTPVDPAVWLTAGNAVLGHDLAAAVVQNVIEPGQEPVREDGAEGKPKFDASRGKPLAKPPNGIPYQTVQIHFVVVALLVLSGVDAPVGYYARGNSQGGE